MATPTAPRDERLDVVLPQLMADLRKRQAMRREEALLAEQRHQFFDLDADSRFPIPPVMHPEASA